jgi:hypothetical protein
VSSIPRGQVQNYSELLFVSSYFPLSISLRHGNPRVIQSCAREHPNNQASTDPCPCLHRPGCSTTEAKPCAKPLTVWTTPPRPPKAAHKVTRATRQALSACREPGNRGQTRTKSIQTASVTDGRRGAACTSPLPFFNPTRQTNPRRSPGQDAREDEDGDALSCNEVGPAVFRTEGMPGGRPVAFR